jgi:hypothetical protein
MSLCHPIRFGPRGVEEGINAGWKPPLRQVRAFPGWPRLADDHAVDRRAQDRSAGTESDRPIKILPLPAAASRVFWCPAGLPDSLKGLRHALRLAPREGPHRGSAAACCWNRCAADIADAKALLDASAIGAEECAQLKAKAWA